MLTKGSNFVRGSNNAKSNWTLGRWIPEATEQKWVQFILRLYHEAQSTVSVLGDKSFPGKRSYQHLNFEKQTGSEPNTHKFQPHKKKKKKKKKKSKRFPCPYLLSCPHYHIFLINWRFRRFSNSLKNFGKCRFLHVRLNYIRVKFSTVLYRFPVCYVMLNSRAAKSYWKLGFWHSEQEFCDFVLFFFFLKKIS